MSNIIEQLESEQLNQNIPDFAPGDTIVVQVKVKEGQRERLQAFEGVVIAKKNRGLNSSFLPKRVLYSCMRAIFQDRDPMIGDTRPMSTDEWGRNVRGRIHMRGDGERSGGVEVW